MNLYPLAFIAVMAGVTLLTRALPFLLFDRGQEPPGTILYLGRLLPPAVMSMLVVYCLRGTDFSAAPGWLPQVIGVGAVVLLHKRKHNTLLSIFGGTLLYMFLVQAVFV
jgi:branched-subunit amino acid transport protein AzlD